MMMTRVIKRTDELVSGDTVRLGAGTVRTVDHVEATEMVNSANEPIVRVLYQEGRTGAWGAGNTALARDLWEVLHDDSGIPSGSSPEGGETVKRSILTMLAVGAALCAFAAPASAHVVTVATGGVTCTGITASWTKFPAGPFDLVIAMQDTANGKAVTSPYLVEHLTGPSGSQTFAAQAAVGVTNRKYLITWTADGGGSVSGSVAVKCCKAPPGTTTTTTTTTPGATSTVTTPGQTVTVTKTVTTPGSTVTVTTPGTTATVTTPGLTTTVTTPGPTTTITTPGPVRTRIVHRPSKPKIVYRDRVVPVNVKCLPGEVGWVIYPYTKSMGLIPGRPILAGCKKAPAKSVKDTGVTG